MGDSWLDGHQRIEPVRNKRRTPVGWVGEKDAMFFPKETLEALMWLESRLCSAMIWCLTGGDENADDFPPSTAPYCRYLTQQVAGDRQRLFTFFGP